MVTRNPDQRHHARAEQHGKAANECRCTAGVLSLPRKCKRKARCPHHRERNNRKKEQEDDDGERCREIKSCEQQRTPNQRHEHRIFQHDDIRYTPRKTCGKNPGEQQSRANHGEDHAVALRRDGIDILKNERGTREVGEECPEHEALEETVPEKITIAQKRRELFQ